MLEEFIYGWRVNKSFIVSFLLTLPLCNLIFPIYSRETVFISEELPAGCQ